MQIVSQEIGGQQKLNPHQGHSSLSGRYPYAVALNAALLILEEVDTSPKSNRPVRLAKVIGLVLDAIYEAAKLPEGSAP